MSDFVFRKNEENTSKQESFSYEQLTKKELSLVLKGVAFFVAILGLVYLSASNGFLFVHEILAASGILSLAFFTHVMSNR